MKVAFWTLGIFIVGLLGLILINLFGNITVTNQLNYTTMKNAVEASMYDALDKVHYRTGFCLCTDKNKVSGKWQFNDDSEYEILDISYDANGKEKCNSKKKCEILHGEYMINKKTFSESLIRRFAEMVNNNKDYELVIQDVIEYPPKVSVRVNSKDTEFSPTEENSGGYTIVNEMDAILETWNDLPTPTPEPNRCWYKDSPTWLYCWGTASKCQGYTLASDISEANCKNVCYCQNSGNTCGIWAKKTWDGYYEVKDSSGKNITDASNCKKACYYKDNPTWLYCWGTADSCGSGYTLENGVTEGNCVNVCYCQNSGNTCGIWAKKTWDGYSELKDSSGKNITDASKCKKSSGGSSGGGGSCGYHYYTNVVTCKTTYDTQKYNEACPKGCTSSTLTGGLKNCTNCPKSVSLGKILASEPGTYASASKAIEDCKTAAANACKNAGYEGVNEEKCQAVRNYSCTYTTSFGVSYDLVLTHRTSVPEGYNGCECLG